MARLQSREKTDKELHLLSAEKSFLVEFSVCLFYNVMANTNEDLNAISTLHEEGIHGIQPENGEWVDLLHPSEVSRRPSDLVVKY